MCSRSRRRSAKRFPSFLFSFRVGLVVVMRLSTLLLLPQLHGLEQLLAVFCLVHVHVEHAPPLDQLHIFPRAKMLCELCGKVFQVMPISPRARQYGQGYPRAIAVCSDDGKRLSISVVLLYTLIQGQSNNQRGSALLGLR
jgi:hypothetical protein